MPEESLRRLLDKYFVEFRQHDSVNAREVEAGLKKCPKELDNEDLILWWKQQGVTSVMPLHSYMFWMWVTKKIEYQLFENVYETLDPILSKSWSMPIEITTGLDSPLLEGGFLNREFSVFQYKFTPANHGLMIFCQEYPPSIKNTENLDLVLDFLSFLLNKYGFGYLGFRQIPARKQTASERATIAVGGGSEIRQDMVDFDFELLENVLTRIETEEEKSVGLSLVELLRVRHRAVLDSSVESKIITLWSGLEAQWGDEIGGDFLLEENEKKQISIALNFLGNKLPKIIEQVGKLKARTRNEKIIEEIGKLNAVNGWDIEKTVRRIHALRSKFAHGGILRDKDIDEVNRNISFMMQIFEELISRKLLQLDILFTQPKP